MAEKDRLALGILAHVDAGKTTLSEAILYITGKIRKLGRVDHKDTFLDTFDMERDRGITIFSKQAVFPLGEKEVTLVDTPGHVDFSAEMERTLQILDYAVLVINGMDGVQGHTQTLWRLLKSYHIPVFLFVNKMDRPETDQDKLMEELKRLLDDNCICFSQRAPQASMDVFLSAEAKEKMKQEASDLDRSMDEDELEAFYEELAMCEENVMEAFLEEGEISKEEIRRLIEERKVFPVYFGSALNKDGVIEFLAGLNDYMRKPAYSEEFGAKVYKISRDEQGARLTWLKVTGGSMKVKMLLQDEEKVDQIRIYSGSKYQMLDEAEAGTLCAITGLSTTYAGQGLGMQKGSQYTPLLEPVLNYQLILPEGMDAGKVLRQLRQLEEEEPMLHIAWNSMYGSIHVQLMGEVQKDLVKHLIEERFKFQVEFGPGNILYKETIAEPVVGVGHYEPLRHYSEVHILMEPGEAGSGLVFATDCSEDVLDRNWQRLILTHMKEKEHIGVLAGAPITDIKMTLIAGRAHLKHTEGGDFRQSTYRAIRQGLRSTKSILLEPWYSFVIELPQSQVGRAMADVQKMYGSFDPPEIEGENAILKGSAPASEIGDYPTELRTYTSDRGRILLELKGYEPCHNTSEVLEKIAYDCEQDLENPMGSIFCSHGAGYYVPWFQVRNYMHIKEDVKYEAASAEAEVDLFDDAFWSYQDEDYDYEEDIPAADVGAETSSKKIKRKFTTFGDDAELEAIMEREFGKKKKDDDKYRGYKKSGGGKGKGGSSIKTGSSKTVYYGSSEYKKPAKTSSQAPSLDSFRKQYNGSYTSSVKKSREKEYLLVDGYNIIFAWEELSRLAEGSLDAARQKLMDILSNYQGYVGCSLILVFDAYRVKGSTGEITKYNNIHVVYTKEAETADQYIEKTTHEIARKYHVTVATSDSTEQVIVMGQGADKISAPDFHDEVIFVERQIREEVELKKDNGRNYLFEGMEEETARILEEVRLGKKSFD